MRKITPLLILITTLVLTSCGKRPFEDIPVTANAEGMESDTLPLDWNKQGNDMENLYFRGRMAFQGEYTYFYANHAIYKLNLSNMNITKLIDDLLGTTSSLNVLGDYIYYVWDISTAGSGYLVPPGNPYIYRMQTDGSNNEAICENVYNDPDSVPNKTFLVRGDNVITITKTYEGIGPCYYSLWSKDFTTVERSQSYYGLLGADDNGFLYYELPHDEDSVIIKKYEYNKGYVDTIDTLSCTAAVHGFTTEDGFIFGYGYDDRYSEISAAGYKVLYYKKNGKTYKQSTIIPETEWNYMTKIPPYWYSFFKYNDEFILDYRNCTYRLNETQLNDLAHDIAENSYKEAAPDNSPFLTDEHGEIYYYNDYVYYCVLQNDDYDGPVSIYRIKTDGTGQEKIF